MIVSRNVRAMARSSAAETSVVTTRIRQGRLRQTSHLAEKAAYYALLKPKVDFATLK